MKAETIMRRISEGVYDDDLAELNGILVARMKLVRRSEGLNALAGLKKGQRVRTQNLRPKYLNGLMATVERIQGEKVLIQIDEDEYTGRYMKRAPVAGNCVEKV